MLLILSIITLNSVSAIDNYETNELVNTEHDLDSYLDEIELFEDSSEVISVNNGNGNEIVNDQYKTTFNNSENKNVVTLQDNELLEDSNPLSYKITVNPLTMYTQTKVKYSVKLTDNCQPVSGARI